MSATLRFLPRSLFAQRAEFVDTNGIPIRLSSKSGKFKALAAIFGPTALAGLLGMLLVYRNNWEQGKTFIANLRKQAKKAAIIGGLAAMGGTGMVYAAISINHGWLAPTARFGEDIRMKCRWSAGYTFYDQKGSKWFLVPDEDNWYLKDDDGGISVFPQPSKWEESADPVTIIDSQVTVVKKQGELNVDKRLTTGNPMSEDKYVIKGGEDRDVVAFSLYLARMDGTMNIIVVFLILAVVMELGTAIIKKLQKPQAANYVAVNDQYKFPYKFIDFE